MEMEINGVTYTLEPGADLSGGDFSGFNFLDLDLTEANFSKQIALAHHSR